MSATVSLDLSDRLVALAHGLEPLMLLAFEAEGFVPPGDATTTDALLKMRLQLTRFQVWLFDQAKRGAP